MRMIIFHRYNIVGYFDEDPWSWFLFVCFRPFFLLFLFSFPNLLKRNCNEIFIDLIRNWMNGKINWIYRMFHDTPNSNDAMHGVYIRRCSNINIIQRKTQTSFSNNNGKFKVTEKTRCICTFLYRNWWFWRLQLISLSFSSFFAVSEDQPHCYLSPLLAHSLAAISCIQTKKKWRAPRSCDATDVFHSKIRNNFVREYHDLKEISHAFRPWSVRFVCLYLYVPQNYYYRYVDRSHTLSLPLMICYIRLYRSIYISFHEIANIVMRMITLSSLLRHHHL